jgi:nitrogen regulatory protein P-II 1
MSVTEARGFGRQRGQAMKQRGQAAPKPEIKFLPKLKLEIVVPEDMVDAAVVLITKLARTGTVGAGKIFIIPVEDAIRIGTGEAGHTAIA